jgi:hypothetical protein
MAPVTVLFKALTAARQPVRERAVTGKLLGPSGWLADHTGTIITDSETVSDADGLVQLQLTPQTEIATAGTCYEIQIADTWARYYCVVPVSNTPVQLADILVDPATLEPVPAQTPTLWLARAELGQPGGVAPLDDDGLVPAEHLPAGGGGGAVDSVNGQTGAVVLTIPATYADLSGVVPTSAIPEIAITRYLGAVGGQAAMLALAGQHGDWCTRVDLGTNWIISGDTPTQLSSWTALSYPAAPVTSVNGQVGIVELGKADVGLGNVADLAPEDLPVSTDQQAALEQRVALAVINAAGDLFVGTGDNTVTRLAKGDDGQALVVDGGAVAWGDLPEGGGLQVDPVAARYGCLALTMHPHAVSWQTPQYLAMSNGRHYLYWVPLAAGTLITGVRLPVQLAGSGGGELHFAVYNDDGSQLGATADVAAQFSGAVAETWQNVPLTAAATTTGAGVWITALSTMDTGPMVVFSNTTNLAEWLLNPASHLTALRREGVAVLPATITPGTAIPYIDIAIGVY